jgi:hypothetical protein
MSIAETFRSYLDRFPKAPAERMAIARAALDAFEKCEKKRRLTADDLKPLVVAACAPQVFVSETGGHLLVQLALRHQVAQQCLLQLAADRKAHVRFNAVHYLVEELPEELRLQIVELALSDRSSMVRYRGVGQAQGFRFKQLLPRLEEMQRTEKDKAVQRVIARCIPMVRDGYWLDPSADGTGYYLTVSTSHSLVGVFIPKEKYSEKFVRREVARLRKAGS